ncbi:MAG: PEP-CTERM sorting domain-containing protein [Burkholderiales bacterium]|nr:PEP-CTERM sorting domain-containing protein [Burkholderiales bacterium]
MIKREGKFLGACLAVALSLGLAAPAMAQTSTLTFDDLGASTGGTHMPDAYQGFTWKGTNWHYMTTTAKPTNDFLALSGNATTIRKIDGSTFFFDGADFWSRRGLDANGNFYFVLSLKGKVVYNGVTLKAKTKFNATPTLLKPPYTGAVDTVAIGFQKPGRGGDWDQLAMDNFRTRPAP